MKKKLCLLFRNLSSSSCFLSHRSYYSFLTATAPTTLHSKPYFFIPILPFSTTTPTTKTTSARKPVAIYLTERLGFSEEQSLAVSKKILHHRDIKSTACDPQVTDLISFEKADNIISFLQEYCGLDLSQVNKVITKCPNILGVNVDKTVKPKVKLLQDLGFTSSDFAHVDPRLYSKYDLSPAIQALRGIMGSDKDVISFFKRLTWGGPFNIINNLIPNVAMLENEYGIPRDKLRKFLTKSPQSLLNNAEWLQDVLVRIEDKWGISRDSTAFLRAVHIFCSLSDDKINSKCQVFRSYGWSDSDILSLIRKHPTCFTSSEARLKKSLEFYMNVLGYDPAYMISQPAHLTYSLENRVVPRHRVLSILKEKGLIEAGYKLMSAIKLTEDGFLNRFIFPYENVVPKLREVFVNGRAPGEATPYGKTSEDETDQKYQKDGQLRRYSML